MFFSGGKFRFDAADDEGKQRLVDTLGQLLQVNRLVLLLGTGCSFHLGAPRIRHVELAKVLELCQRAGVTVDGTAVSVLEALVGTGINLEILLGQLNAAINYAVSFSLEEVQAAGVKATLTDLQTLFAAVNVGIARACDLPQGASIQPPHDQDPWYSHREFFRRLLGARRPDSPRVAVFTTNYDTVIERTLDDAGVHYLDGFVGGVRRAMQLSSYENDLFSRGQAHGRLVRVRDVVHLYKLHGSLTWRAELSASGVGSTTIVQAAGAPSSGELAVIYPTPTKEADVMGYPYADLLREFGAAISSPECALIILGYGFADDHINRLIYQALATNSTLQVLAVDPVGVVAGPTSAADREPTRADTPVGRLSQVLDARVSVLSGDTATFSEFALALPDVGEPSLAQQNALEEMLGGVLDPPKAPGDEFA